MGFKRRKEKVNIQSMNKKKKKEIKILQIGLQGSGWELGFLEVDYTDSKRGLQSIF